MSSEKEKGKDRETTPPDQIFASSSGNDADKDDSDTTQPESSNRPSTNTQKRKHHHMSTGPGEEKSKKATDDKPNASSSDSPSPPRKVPRGARSAHGRAAAPQTLTSNIQPSPSSSRPSGTAVVAFSLSTTSDEVNDGDRSGEDGEEVQVQASDANAERERDSGFHGSESPLPPSPEHASDSGLGR